jgi:ATP-dependent RNA helicase RhlE
VSLVCVDEHKLLADIEKVLKRALPKEALPGFEPDPRIKAEPIPNGRNNRGGSMPGCAPHAPARADAPRQNPGRGQQSNGRPSTAAHAPARRGNGHGHSHGTSTARASAPRLSAGRPR